jgi:hypothetical protein
MTKKKTKTKEPKAINGQMLKEFFEQFEEVVRQKVAEEQQKPEMLKVRYVG